MADAVNYVHQDENWRQRVASEIMVTKRFHENWGFLTEERPDPDEPKIKFDTRLIKYFNPNGGTWTVKKKRVPERCYDEKADESAKLREDKSAVGTARKTHTRRLQYIEGHSSTFITKSSLYGNRETLEQFGIGEYGRARTSITNYDAQGI